MVYDYDFNITLTPTPPSPFSEEVDALVESLGDLVQKQMDFTKVTVLPEAEDINQTRGRLSEFRYVSRLVYT